MRIPLTLSTAFGDDFESEIRRFVVEEGMVPDETAFGSERFLTRSVIPHVERLSRLFNRIEDEPADERAPDGPRDRRGPTPHIRPLKSGGQAGLDPYWKDSSNPENFRLAYFLAFMPGNAARVASVISELGRLGFRFPAAERAFRGIEFGAGPATGAVGVAAGNAHSEIGIPREGNWALIEQDRAVLSLGEKWARRYFPSVGMDWSVRPFHRTIDWEKPLLPKNAPSFHLWLSSYFVNEAELPLDRLAARLVDNWEFHLEEEGLAILVEPALRAQSRRLLELRKHLIAEFANPRRRGKYQVLLPCLGHQACGALAAEGDWCHEEITWWRPKYLRKIDELAGLDRKSLPFSYLVIAKSGRPRAELLPALAPGGVPAKTDRLVSPAHAEGRDLEFFVCGEDGKRRARYRPEDGAGANAEGEASANDAADAGDEVSVPRRKREPAVQRGSILLDAEIRGDARAGRVDRLKGIL